MGFVTQSAISYTCRGSSRPFSFPALGCWLVLVAAGASDTHEPGVVLAENWELAAGARAGLRPPSRYNSTAPGGLAVPQTATYYDGVLDERATDIVADSRGETHIFALGDWGALLPSHKTAPNKRGYDALGRKKMCPYNCGYVWGIDDKAQILVAESMKKRAEVSNPRYVLNVGDNFYWSGVEEKCGTILMTPKTNWSFREGWIKMYGEPLTSVPWLSCLGNHDYGGYKYDHGWPQQIGYSFVNHNWIMPARYYQKTMRHRGYTVDVFMIDSNAYDAKPPHEDPMHNICSRKNNGYGSNCAAGGGPTSTTDCPDWFWATYTIQKDWLAQRLAASRADWQIVVTHFPCGHDSKFYKLMHEKYGLDLLVTGHRHQQELWAQSRMFGGMTCFVTGGGGGITSEKSPGHSGSSQYGFFDLTISKEKMLVELVAINGAVIRSTMVYPVERPVDEGNATCSNYGCSEHYDPGQECQCNTGCLNYGSCCADYSQVCMTSVTHSSTVLPTTPPGGFFSCQHYGCGGGYKPENGCQCNVDCRRYRNCCADFDSYCEVTSTSNSPEERF